MKWAIRDLLNPVATRSLLYGADPFDLEYILKKIDGIKVKSGKQIQSLPVTERGETDITVYASGLSAGMYIYTLVVDGQVKVTRKMMVTE